MVRVARTAPDSGKEAFPAARTVGPRYQRMALALPAVEVADDRHCFGIRGPHREGSAAGGAVRPELFVEARVRAFPEQVDVVIGERSARGELAHLARDCGISHGSVPPRA